MLFTILKSICHLFGDKFANAMRFAGYSYLIRKHGYLAMHGSSNEPAYLLPESYDPINSFRQDGKERDPEQLDSSWDSYPRDPLTNAQLRDVYPEDYE